MNSEEPSQAAASSGPHRTKDDAAALAALVNALTPLDQVARIRLLKTICTFFELEARDLLPEGADHRRAFPGIVADSERKTTSSPTFSEDRSLSPKAFLIEKRPQSDTERIACLAYYLTHYRDQPTFKTLDLSKLNTEAAQIKLSNPTRAVDNAASSHFLIPAGQGTKQLSAIGELYVQALPDRTAAKEAVADLKRRRSKTRPKTPQSEDNGPLPQGSQNPASEEGGVDEL